MFGYTKQHMLIIDFRFNDEGALEMNGIAIVVASFDGYKDIWPVFISAKERFWPDCPYKTYLVSNFETVCSDAVTPIHTGAETNWCNRMEKALNEIPEDTVVLLLEDYLMGEKVQTGLVEQYLRKFQNERMEYLRIIDIPKANGKQNQVTAIDEDVEYGVNLQPSIWNKEYLIKLLSSIDGTRSAWDFEVTLLKDAHKGRNIPKKGCYAFKGNLLNIHNGVLKGKWFPNEVRYFKKQGILVDTSVRPLLSFKESTEYRIRMILRNVIPKGMRRDLKKILKKFGMKFASDV